ncbi:MAG: hypothetical protein GF416_02585 [Candidatus Altiarchaeales archaeon]|nr:hypothetical protein [Candidatus Altiarchaeales archaeon]MBD3416006.1 hypothetical protein [Candidatus Altiarchaeales archaeon]
MRGKAILKVPGGKLLKADVRHENGRILKAKVTGDFFMHPESRMDELDEQLRGIKAGDVRKVVKKALEGAELYGVDAESIVKVICEAVK